MRHLFKRCRAAGWLAGVGMLFSLNAIVQAQTPAVADGTDRLEWLGQPTLQELADHPFARNVWDLQVYQGRLYIASGSADDTAPGGSPPQTHLWYYTPSQNVFRFDHILPETQIDLLVLVEQALVIPGTDSNGSWQTGSLYFQLRDTWIVWDQVPRGIHVYDVAFIGGRLFITIGSDNSEGFSVVSSVDGQQWNRYNIPLGQEGMYASTSLRWLPVGDQWFVNVFPAQMLRQRVASDGGVVQEPIEIGGSFYRMNIDAEGQNVTFEPASVDFFMGQHSDPNDSVIPRVMRTARRHDGGLLYIGSTRDYGQAPVPFGLFSIDPALHVQTHTFEADERPYDVIVDGEMAYALLVSAQADGAYRMRVMRSADLAAWEEVVRFSAPTFARSFALLDDMLYFGFGTNAEPLAPESGMIARIRRVITPPESP
ncbi:MAG: hypothetical protein SF162_12775 [bacterium]|nr:hypothetical protein [bacterium]